MRLPVIDRRPIVRHERNRRRSSKLGLLQIQIRTEIFYCCRVAVFLACGFFSFLSPISSNPNDISVEFRPRRHREAQPLLDIDKLDVGLAWRNGYRNPLEFGHDGLGLRTLAHHRIAQGDLDLPRTAHRSEYDAALNADLDDQGGTLHRALAGGLAERKLVAQVARSRVGALGRNIQG